MPEKLFLKGALKRVSEGRLIEWPGPGNYFYDQADENTMFLRTKKSYLTIKVHVF